MPEVVPQFEIYGLNIAFKRIVQNPYFSMLYTIAMTAKTQKINFTHGGSLSRAFEMNSIAASSCKGLAAWARVRNCQPLARFLPNSIRDRSGQQPLLE